MASFDGTEYGPDYLSFKERDVIVDVAGSEVSQGWAWGCVVLPEDRLSEPGWYPQEWVEKAEPRT